jgi:hypothetical protein
MPKILRLGATILATALFASAAPAHAAYNVGDKAALKMAALDNKGEVELDNYKGRIVLVEFWATNNEASMKEAEHKLQINKTWGPKGLVMISVSADEAADAPTKLASEKGFTWSQIHDPGSLLKAQWGVTDLPHAFLVGPKGTVLWHGKFDKLDEQIDKAFKANASQLVDAKVIEEATVTLDKMEAAIKESGHANAMALFPNIPPEARNDGPIAKRLTDVEKQLTEYADRTITEADQLIKDKKFLEAGTRLLDITRALPNTSAANNARKKLTAMMSQPGARQQYETIQKARAAEEELLAAKRLQGEGKSEQAYAKFKYVVNTYAGTRAATEAKATVEQLEKDPNFVKKATDVATESKVKSMFTMAEAFKRAGRDDRARDKYLDITKLYPGTQWAAQAEQEIKALDKKPKPGQQINQGQGGPGQPVPGR